MIPGAILKAFQVGKKAVQTYNAGKQQSQLMPGPAPAGFTPVNPAAKAVVKKAPPVKKAAPKPAPKPKPAAPKPAAKTPPPPPLAKTTYTILGTEFKKSTVHVTGALLFVAGVAGYAYHRSR
jgi:hypothetical protein